MIEIIIVIGWFFMVEIFHKFGRNAGKIWVELNKRGPLEGKTILKKTRLKEEDFYAAVGWLAREDKISYKAGIYELNQTNLEQEIGGNAGKVYTTLYNHGEITIPSIVKIAKIHKKEAYSAIGWLAREDKLGYKKNTSNIDTVEYKLK